MKTVEFTLYEILGYIFPGAVTMLGVYLLLWKFMLSPEQNWDSLSGSAWSALLAIAYVLGHSVQAVTNLMQDVTKFITTIVKGKRSRSRSSNELPPIVVTRAKESVGLGPSDALSDDTVYEIADHIVLQRGKTETRDMYIYREGFYRGMAFALLVLAFGCLIHIFDSEITLAAFGLVLQFTRLVLASIGITALVMACLYLNRYRQFLRYRKNYAIYSFLVISSKSPAGAGPSTT